MAIAQKAERTYLYVVFYLVLIHIVVSIVFAFLDYSRRGAKDARGTLVWSGTAWVVSLLVCLTVLILVLYSLRYEKQLTETPTPIQFSYPGFGKDRKDIENFLNSTNLPPYDKSRVYIVLTKYYLKKIPIETLREKLSTFEPSFKPSFKPSALPDLKQYDAIPIGYVVGEKIFTLKGINIWPLQSS